MLTGTLRRTLFVSSSGLENAKRLVSSYKTGEAKVMTPEIWQAKKVVDSTLHPGKKFDIRSKEAFAHEVLDTGEPVFLPFRMSCFVISNLVVTAGMLTPGMGVRACSSSLITTDVARHSVLCRGKS